MKAGGRSCAAFSVEEETTALSEANRVQLGRPHRHAADKLDLLDLVYHRRPLPARSAAAWRSTLAGNLTAALNE